MPSTVIHSIHYHQRSERLTIEFVSGLIYYYEKVPAPVYEAFKTSRSKGTYFNQHIKGHYAFERGDDIADSPVYVA